MRRRNQISMGEAKALAQEEQERQDKLNEKGLCLHCEDNPQNPALNAKVCLECYKNDVPGGCMAKGCPNSSVGSFQQAELCGVHLTDAIHNAYESYLEMKAELEEQRKELDDRVEELDFNPAKTDKAPRDMTEKEKELRDKAVELDVEERDLNFLKGDIKRAMDSLDEPFPTGYEVFG